MAARSEVSHTSAGLSERRHSPIPYRFRPLDYSPAITCFCNRKAAMWISWSDNNPGRRYYGCYRGVEGGCTFHSWIDGPATPFVASLLVDLRDTVWTLKRQKEEQAQMLAQCKVENQELKTGMQELKKKLKMKAERQGCSNYKFWFFIGVVVALLVLLCAS